MLCFGQPSATEFRSMPRLTGGPSDSSARASSLGRLNEHEGREILQDIVDPVLGPRWNEHNAPGTHLAILSPHPNSCAAADDVVDLILGMGRLLVLAAPGEFVQATTHRRDPQELEVCLASSPARLEEIRDFVSLHQKCLATGQRVLG